MKFRSVLADGKAEKPWEILRCFPQFIDLLLHIFPFSLSTPPPPIEVRVHDVLNVSDIKIRAARLDFVCVWSFGLFLFFFGYFNVVHNDGNELRDSVN